MHIEDNNIETITNEIQMLYARLLFKHRIELDDKLITEQLSKEFKNFRCTDDIKDNTTRHFFFDDYTVKFPEGIISAQCTLFIPDSKDYINKNLNEAYRQIWHWPEGEDETKDCEFEIVLTDLMTRTLDYKVRVELFQKYVSSIAKALNPIALYFPSSKKLVETTKYLNLAQNTNDDFLYGLLNIRLFTVENNGMLMDSLGLNTLGLPDFQIYFSQYEPGQIFEILRNYAYYIFENGSVIEDGNTVEGIESGSIWECKYNEAYIEPKRFVIEIKE